MAVLFLSMSAFAQQAREEFHVGPSARSASFADIQNSAAKITSRFALGRLTADERIRLTQGDQNDLRAKVGITRKLDGAVFDLRTSSLAAMELPAELEGGLLERRGGDYVWTAGVSSEGAGALRLNLRNGSLPKGAQIFVYSATGEVHGPYSEKDVTDSYWTNTVFADEVFVEIQFSAAAERVHLEIAAVLHLEHRDFAPPRGGITIAGVDDDYACFVRTACVSNSEFPTSALNDRARGVGAMQYIASDDGNGYVCTGSLLNDTDTSTVIPYFITANHCIQNQSEANTLEVFWDYKYSSCGGFAPDKAAMPRQSGATFLATSPKDKAGSDMTLMRLTNTPPGSRWYFGWNADDIRKQAGITTYRLHHPNGEPMHYSRERTLGLDGTSAGYGGYFFSEMQYGANFGGSSGSPVFTFDASTGAQVVGTLTGARGATQQDLESYCSYDKYIVQTGAFSQHFALIRQYLAPGSGAQPAPCVDSGTVVCLVGNRFEVGLKFNGQTMQAIKFTPNTGLFWAVDNTNIEVLLKMVDACGFNSRFWVFAGGTTNQTIDITVTDTRTGAKKTYNNPANTNFRTITDTGAFGCP